jgi:hypothetical protein
MADELAPWLALAGIGAFHGLNPGMGWLFAVALGLHRASRRAVWLSLVPIALGHALSVAAVVLAVVALGVVINYRIIGIVGGLILLAWAGYHVWYGHRHRVRIGMTAGFAGLGLWSFLMATSHGAGLMLLPVVIPLCLASTPAGELTATGSVPLALAAVGVHMAALLLVTALIAGLVYEWFGVAFLRRGWINLDLVWTAALALAGVFLLISSM